MRKQKAAGFTAFVMLLAMLGMGWGKGKKSTTKVWKDIHSLAKITKKSSYVKLVSEMKFYVSRHGSDAWDGSSPDHEAGTTTGPWQTISHAITQIRLQPGRHPRPTAATSAELNILSGFLPLSKKLLPPFRKQRNHSTYVVL